MEHKAFQLQRVPDGKIAGGALCRLGNQMFCTAAAMTYSSRTSREFIGMVKGTNLSDYPENLMNTVMRNVKWCSPEDVKDFYRLEHGPWLCDGFPDTDIKDIYFDDFFQDARCIDRDIAFELFKPYESILEAINELYGDISGMVAINVRRGDYLRVERCGFRVMSKELIASIIDDCYDKEDRFIFVSDDINWCKENFNGPRFMFADKPYPNKPEIDLYLQTQTKSNVISNSTFSWWGAYLNKNWNVVCPWPWFHSGMINSMENILPKEWIKFENK